MFNEESLRLQQALMEYAYSKHTIKEIILNEVQTELGDVIVKGEALISKYVNADYYPGKGARIDTIANEDFGTIVTTVICSSLVIEYPEPIQRIVTRVANILPYECRLEAAKTAAELVIVLAELDVYDIILANSSESGSMQIVTNIVLSDDVKEVIIGKKYLPPMLCKPNVIDSNLTCKHLTTGKKSLILGKGNHHKEPLAYDAINIASSVELELNQDILQFTETSKKGDTKLDTETMDQFIDRTENHALMARESRKVYDEIGEQSFYLTWDYDKRGRMYSSGYHINIQSSEYKKAVIQLKNKHLITGV